MSDLIRTILIMSIAGSIIAVLLFTLKPLVRNRLPKSTQYYLWLVVIAALLVPFSLFATLPFANDASLLPVSPAGVVERFVITSEEELDRIASIVPQGLREERNNLYMSEVKKVESPISTAVTFLSLFYPIGALVVLLYFSINYWLFTRTHRRHNTTATPEEHVTLIELCSGNRNPLLYRNPLAATPMLIGLFRPAIILPDRAYTNKQLHAVLLHELTHLRRKDVFVKWLSVVASALHWFNPIVWLVRREIDRACELSCDEAVIRNLDTDGKQNYGDTLLYVASDSKMPHAVLSTTMCEEKKALKERLGAIMKSKKHSRLAITISAVLLVAVGGTAIALGAGRAEVLVLPDADTVLSISMNQYNDYIPSGEVVINDKNEIAKILNDLSGASKLWGMSGTSVNDYPVDDNYLVIDITTQNEGRRLSLYSDSRDYIEEPYIGIYRAKQRFDYMHSLYNRYSDHSEADIASVGILPDNLNVPHAVLDSAIDCVKGDFDGYQDIGLAALKEAGAEFDNWRIDFIEHVYRYDDRNIDVYRFQWRIHTTTPDVVRAALAGGMDLDDEGWLLDTYPNSWYLILMDGEVQFTMMANDCSPGDELFTEDMRKRLSSDDTLPSSIDNAVKWYLNENLFSDEEVAAAKAIVEKYFNAWADKDEDAWWATWSSGKPENAASFGDWTITLKDIRYNPQDSMRESYVRNGRGSVNNTSIENVIVFKCDFNVHYPDGIATSAFNEGDYSDWGVILIRQNAQAEWLIDDNGY